MTRPIPFLLALLLAAGASACKKETTCTSDLALCGGSCTALATDAANCGACGHACAANEQCRQGQCFCPDGRVSCGGTCVDLASDPAHCGACDVSCGGALLCTTSDAGSTSCAGACAGTGQTACDRACVNLETQAQNCGACGRACGTNEHCAAGRCLADLYLACFNTNEVREATAGLEPAGVPLAVAPGPGFLAWSGALLAVASAELGGAETLATIHFDPPGVRRTDVLETSVASPDLEYLAEHGGLLYVAHASLGTLLIVDAGGAIVDEARLAPALDPNPGPQGIAFDGDHAWIALNARDEVLVLDVSGVPSCAAHTAVPPCTREVARLDLGTTGLNPLNLASAGARPMPSRVAVTGGRAFVTLWNLDASFNPPPGSTGRLAVFDTATQVPDADFAGSTNGLLDLGPSCLDPADVAVESGIAYVTCGAFDYANGRILAAGVSRIDVSGAAARLLPPIAVGPDRAPGKLAFCGATGYVGDRNSGNVLVLDPASAATSLGSGVELCPPSNGFAFVADIACGR